MNMLYHFINNSYGQSYTVMSDTPENALKAVKKYLWKNDRCYGYKEWKDATVDKLPNYGLVVIKQNEVLRTES